MSDGVALYVHKQSLSSLVIDCVCFDRFLAIACGCSARVQAAQRGWIEADAGADRDLSLPLVPAEAESDDDFLSSMKDRAIRDTGAGGGGGGASQPTQQQTQQQTQQTQQHKSKGQKSKGQKATEETDKEKREGVVGEKEYDIDGPSSEKVR